MQKESLPVIEIKSKIIKCIVCQSSRSWYLLVETTKEDYDSTKKMEQFTEMLYEYKQDLLANSPGLNEIFFIFFPGDKFDTEILLNSNADNLYKNDNDNNDDNIDELVKLNKDAFLLSIKDRLPSLYGSLKNTGWLWDGKKLVVEFSNPVNKELARKKDAKGLIKEYFYPVFENKLDISFKDGQVSFENDDTDSSNGGEKLYETIYIKEEPKKASNRREQDSKSESHESGPVLLGKKINDKGSVPLNEIVEEDRSMVVEGKVFNLETRLLKSKRQLVIFYMTDYTDSISVKFFLGENDVTPGGLADDNWVKVRGDVITDQFTQELTLQAKDINRVKAKDVRLDEAIEKRVELHAHTKMSALDCTCSATALVERAEMWGHEAIAITDHGVVQSYPEAFEAAAKKDVKVIYGIEAYLVEDEDDYKARSYHCIILVKNGKGLEDLYKLVSDSHIKFFYKKPRIPKNKLKDVRENLIIGSACEAGELISTMINCKKKGDINENQEKIKEVARFYDFLEIQPPSNNEFMLREKIFNDVEELYELNKNIVKIARELDKPFCASGDVHFLEPWDEIYRKILMAGQGFSDISQPPLYFKTTEEMLEEFEHLGKQDAYEAVIANPGKIAAEIEEIKPIPDDLYTPEIPGANGKVKEMTYNQAKEMYGDPLPDIIANRIEEELSSIIDQGYAVIYYISYKLTKKSMEDGYLVGSRGSVGSSLVATLCEITEVNPMPPHYRCPSCKFSEFIQDGSVGSGVDLPDKNCPSCTEELIKDGYDIPFAVFMGFHGEKVPDIDLNFSGEYQPRAHEYIEEYFGKESVFRAGTIGTIAKKTAYGFVRGYYNELGKAPRQAEIDRLVEGCTGTKRTTGQHPGGLMIVPQNMDIHSFCPVQHPADNKDSQVKTTHFDYGAISSRLLKLDVLGHDVPTIIHMLETMTRVNALEIPLDDQETIEIFSKTDPLGVSQDEIGCPVGTLGIPEFGTSFVRQMLEDTRPTSFSELIRISGLSHGTDVWLNNAQDLVAQDKVDLNQVISTRDDIMVYLMYKGMDPQTAFTIMERVRKSKGLPDDLIQKMKDLEIPDWYIESCLKIKYLFPKAHAVAYTMMSFRIAYFKVYHPAAFYAAFFTVKAEDFDSDLVIKGPEAVNSKLEEIINKGNNATPKEKSEVVVLEVVKEMYTRGIEIEPVDLYRSHSNKFKLTDENKLLPPLVTLKGLGLSVAEQLVEKRQEMKEFLSIEDLKKRCKVPKTAIEVMKEHGCLNELPENNQLSLF